jgi:hypothetical protein
MHDKNGTPVIAGTRARLIGTVTEITSQAPTFCKVVFRADEKMAPGVTEPPFDLALSARMLEVISEGESDTGKSEAKVNRSEQRRPAPFQMSIPTNLPAFQCHKQVRAARIHSIVQSPAETSESPDKGAHPGGGSWELRLEGQSQPAVVSNDWFSRHSPEVGGYLVAYEDGYTSYSPAAAFEGGYKAI